MTEISLETPEAHKDYIELIPRLQITIKGEEKTNAIWEIALSYGDGTTYFYSDWSSMESLMEVLIEICQGWDYGY